MEEETQKQEIIQDKYTLSEQEEQRVSNLPYSLPLKLRSILRGFKWAMNKKNTSAVMIIDGKSGLGKTTLSFQCANYVDPKFTLAKVYYNPTQFLEGLESAEPGSAHVFDEAMLLSNRSAMSQLNRAIIIAMSMIRSKRLFIIFNINSIFDMERNLVLSRADILLHIYGDSLTDRGKFMAFFKGEDGDDRLKLLHILGKKYYDYSKPKSNFNAPFSSYFIFDEEEYEKAKNVGVKEFLLGGNAGKSDKSRRSRDDYVRWLSKNTELSKEEIANIGGLSLKTIYNIRNGLDNQF
jgi:hypothetical protein